MSGPQLSRPAARPDDADHEPRVRLYQGRAARCFDLFAGDVGGEAELHPLQRIPHYDHSSGEVIAIMHYLLGSESGGTAFYRHRRTGFETVTPDREDAYNAALALDEREHGMPPDTPT